MPTWAQRQGFADNQEAIAGAKLFASSGCPTCHTYLGAGSSNLGAPDLSAEGTKGQREGLLQSSYVSDPSKYGNNVMPKFALSATSSSRSSQRSSTPPRAAK